MKEKLILIGGGGHCSSCIDIIEQHGRFKIEGIVDVPENLNKEVLGYKIIATDAELPQLVKDYNNCFITIGQIKSPEKRQIIFQILKKNKATLPTIVSPSAYVSSHAKIGKGTIIMHHSIINAGANVGNNCIINTKALIEHDAVIKDHCHIATGAIINGGVKIDSGTFIGSNSVCKELITIGTNKIVGCGEKVTRDIN